MRSKTLITIAALLLAGTLVWITFRTKAVPDLTAAKQVSASAETGLTIRESVRKPETRENRDDRLAQSPKEAYAASAKCLGVTEESQIGLQKEIESLESDLGHIDTKLQESFKREIAEKKQALAANISCLSRDHPVTQDELRDLLLAAAQSGDIASQLQYARDPLIDQLHSISHIDELRQWKQLSQSYVASAAESGNVDAILLQAEAADPFRCQASNNQFCAGLFTNLVDENPLEAYKQYYLASLLHPQEVPPWVKDELSALQTLLSSADVEKAKASAEKVSANLTGR